MTTAISNRCKCLTVMDFEILDNYERTHFQLYEDTKTLQMGNFFSTLWSVEGLKGKAMYVQ